MNALQSFLLTLPLLLSSELYAQKTITGKVLNEKTKEVIPFATVSSKNTNYNVLVDINGFFRFQLGEKIANDTLIFKVVGFKHHKIAIRDFHSPFEVYLHEDVNTLKEVTVSNKRIDLQIGNFNVSSTTLFNRGLRHAKRFEMPSTHQYLKEIIILRDVSDSRQSQETKFRINIYDENPKTKGPGKKIYLDSIEVDDLNNSQIRIDVTKYNISILNSPFFVSVETLLIPYNERYSIYRAGEVIEGVREHPAYYEVTYQPYLKIGRAKDNEGWFSSAKIGSKWKEDTYAPAIKVVVN